MALRDCLNALIESFFQCHWDLFFCLKSLLKHTPSFMKLPTASHKFQPSWAKQDIAQSWRLVRKAAKLRISWKPLKLVISSSRGVLSLKNKQTPFKNKSRELGIFFPIPPIKSMNSTLSALLSYNIPQGKSSSTPVPPALHRWSWYSLQDQGRTFPLRKTSAALCPSWSQWDEDVLAALTEKDCWWQSHCHTPITLPLHVKNKQTNKKPGRLQKIL